MKGKTVVITGGTSGIGEVAAEALAKMGARIVLVARNKSRGEATLSRLRGSGPGAVHSVFFADLTRLTEMKRVAAQIAAQEPRIDVLINNAGFSDHPTLDRTDPQGWRDAVNGNLNGAYNCACAVLPGMRAKGGGAIVNILATQSFTGGPGMAHNAAAKAGVGNLTKSLAVEWAPDGIRVNALASSTDMVSRGGRSSAAIPSSTIETSGCRRRMIPSLVREAPGPLRAKPK